jgi:hypothetical protein
MHSSKLVVVPLRRRGMNRKKRAKRAKREKRQKRVVRLLMSGTGLIVASIALSFLVPDTLTGAPKTVCFLALVALIIVGCTIGMLGVLCALEWQPASRQAHGMSMRWNVWRKLRMRLHARKHPLPLPDHPWPKGMKAPVFSKMSERRLRRMHRRGRKDWAVTTGAEDDPLFMSELRARLNDQDQ